MPYPTTEMELTPAAFRGPAFPSIFVQVVGFLGPARKVAAPSSGASPSLKCDPRSQLDLPGAKQVGARSASGSETGLRKQRDATEHVLSHVDAVGAGTGKDVPADAGEATGTADSKWSGVGAERGWAPGISADGAGVGAPVDEGDKRGQLEPVNRSLEPFRLDVVSRQFPHSRHRESFALVEVGE